MPGPTATTGVVGVPCSSATDRTTPTAARRAEVGWFQDAKTPLKSPLVQRGTLFSSNVAPQRGRKNSFANEFLVPVPITFQPLYGQTPDTSPPPAPG
jgi:hypothetical protein